MSDLNADVKPDSDPILEKLSRLAGESFEQRDERLPRLLVRCAAGDRLSAGICVALSAPEREPSLARDLADIDTWWALRDYLQEARPPVEGLEAGLDRLVELAQRWGDAPSVRAFADLRATIRSVLATGAQRALSKRAAARIELVNPELQSSVGQADAYVATYLGSRRTEDLAEAVEAWHEILISEQWVRSEPSLQLSFFNDAGVLMRDLLDLRPDPVLLDRAIRCWESAFMLFRDEAVVPSAWLANLAPRLDLAGRNLGKALLSRYREDGRPDDLEAAIRQLEGAAQIMSPEAPSFRTRLADLGMALAGHPDEETVVRGIDSLYYAAALESDDMRRAPIIAAFARTTWESYGRLRSQRALTEALTAAHLVRGSSGAAAILADEVRRELERLRDRDEISLRLSAALVTAALKPELLFDMAVAVHAGDLAEMIRMLTRLLGTPQSDAAVAALNYLASEALIWYSKRRHDLHLLDHAVEALTPVVSHAAAASPERRTALQNLSVALNERYQRRGSAEDLESAIRLLEGAASEAPADSGYFGTLSVSLGLRHRQTGSTEDLNRSIELIERALAEKDAAPSSRVVALAHLADALVDRWNLAGCQEDLERALDKIDEGLAVADSAERSHELLGLRVLCLKARYDTGADRHDLEEALSLCTRLLSEVPSDSKERPGLLHEQGNCLRSMYALDPRPSLIDDAIRAYKQAIAETLPRAPSRAGYLSDLGTALGDRYELTGDLQDLEDSILAHQEALAVAIGARADRPLILDHLSGALRRRFRHTRSLDDLQAAVAHAREAVNGSAHSDPNRASYLNKLGNALYERYLQSLLTGTKQYSDLEQAAAAHDEAARTARPDSVFFPSCLNNLGRALTALYLDSAEPQPAMLERAVRNFERAAAHPAASLTDLPSYWGNLGIALKNQISLNASVNSADRATDAFRKSCTLGMNSAPEGVIHAALSWGDWALSRSSFSEAAEAYGYALDAMRNLFRVQLTREHKETWLRRAQRISVLAAYARARSGDAPAAVEDLEAGRALLLSEALALDRAELGRLVDAGRSELRERYARAAARWRQLSTSPPVAGEGLRGETLANVLRNARQELDAAIEEIRSVDGYEGFLARPTFADALKGAGEDPLVYLAAAESGGLALIVRPEDSSVSTVWLPKLIQQSLLDHVSLYLNAYLTYRSNRSNCPPPEEHWQTWLAAIDTVTVWLWDAAMDAVLETLGAARRVTLVPAGLLALLPLHAAWTPDESAPTGRRYVLDTTTVLYAPNARALVAAREALRKFQSEHLVAVNEPAWRRLELKLPFSQVEVGMALAVFADHEVLEDKQATPAAVRDALAGGDVLHLSCHGSADLAWPLESALVLAEEEPLRLRDILGSRLRARLAVLSACESGIPGDELPDEVVSFPTGLLQAGAAGVVASLWSVPGLATALLMFRFYELWRTGEGMASDEALAQAQIWVRNTTNAEKIAHFRNLRSSSEHPLIAEAARTLQRELALDPARSRDERTDAHPYHWAAFTYSGVARGERD